jgi:prepilin-type N-terminal cleavage/methylation domain-containing protein
MKTQPFVRTRGFTLLETVIAIGVLAVLLTGFMVVFAPAADGIRKSINVQQADRMASTLEQELVTPRAGQEGYTPLQEPATFQTGFDKAFFWIRNSNSVKVPLLAYQYRGKISSFRPDGTPTPEPDASGKQPGEDYIVVPMVRRLDETEFTDDLAAVEGAVYLVKGTQLVFDGGQLKSGTPGKIFDPKDKTKEYSSTDLYPEAVVAFSADFYLMPSKSASYFKSDAFKNGFPKLKSPVFTRNLAVRR